MSGDVDGDPGQRRCPKSLRAPADVSAVLLPAHAGRGHQLHVDVSQLERELILRCLRKTGGNKRQAARLLNLSRTTLIDKLQRLGVSDSSAA